nr:type III-B CRISPR-associated protein Cas10/Cmr2 [Gloeocapsopsis dulcis]
MYWQAKIWGLLHDPTFKVLFSNEKGNSSWQKLAVMQDWRDNKQNLTEINSEISNQILIAKQIASASDRAAISSLTNHLNYAPSNNRNFGLEISHLLSGAKQEFKLNASFHNELASQGSRVNYFDQIERTLFSQQIVDPEDRRQKPLTEISHSQKVFWWLWRCLPVAACDALGNGTRDESLFLIPAQSQIPDGSMWNQASLTAAIAGTLVATESQESSTHPYLATFSFTPVQELIKASRKMRDLWAGSWILHYLSAKVCWKLAWKYGPDCLVYPSLFQQPLIDHWLLQQWVDFQPWIQPPSDRQILTAGFPNVLVLILPKDKVRAAMQMAQETLKAEWMKLSNLVFQELQQRCWMRGLAEDNKTWNGWLNSQWQTYWSALPIGKEGEELTSSTQYEMPEFQAWTEAQNQAFRVSESQRLFQETELNFLKQVREQQLRTQENNHINIGSWWSHVFDQTRLALTAIKSARTWQLPTAFGVRSTVSGLGCAVHPGPDWMSEGEIKKFWKNHAGLFDGSEQLNATETVKRGLHLILPQLLNLDNNANTKLSAAYPDLTMGVAGYLKVSDRTCLDHFHRSCYAIQNLFSPQAQSDRLNVAAQWGIPWIDSHPDIAFQKHHPRFLNAGWLIEDLETPELSNIQKQIDAEADSALVESLSQEFTRLKTQYRHNIQQIIDRHYPANNPADWYILAAGDGDGMSEWLKGQKLHAYRQYVPANVSVPEPLQAAFDQFLTEKKRMGPATHGALSRALLDFSNQLVPYLTEQRYAGRLIYGGGDDVLAYTNLWEWDNWLWDIRQCFRGAADTHQEFSNQGDYWQWCRGEIKRDRNGHPLLSTRPLFTMGREATISFGLVIAHHSVPLAIALENLWDAEKEGAKKHQSPDGKTKDALQVRVLYGNGNVLQATSKFDVFHQWQSLLQFQSQYPDIELDPALFEQAAQMWEQHPAPNGAAISCWAQAFCQQRELFKQNDSAKVEFQQLLSEYLTALQQTTQQASDRQIQNWLKLAAFVLRCRKITLGGVK